MGTIRTYRARDLSPGSWYCQTWCPAAGCCSSAVPAASTVPAAPAAVLPAAPVVPAAPAACWIRQWTVAGTVLQQPWRGCGVQEEVLESSREREGRVLYIVISIGPGQQSYAVCNVGCHRLYDYKLEININKIYYK